MSNEQLEKINDHLIDYCADNGMMIGCTGCLGDEDDEDPFIDPFRKESSNGT